MQSRFSKIFMRSVLLILTVLFSGTALAEETPWPEVTPDGLHRVTWSRYSVVYLAPDADLKPYDRIRLMQPVVRFKKNWEGKEALMTENRGLETAPELAISIRKKMSVEFMKVFTETLEKGGYGVVQEDGADVLLVRPAIINVKAVIPNDAGVDDTGVIVRSAGEMTLFLEVFDSVTGELIGKGLDLKEDTAEDAKLGGFGYFWSDMEPEKNRALIDRAFTKWADSLVAALDDLRSN